MPLLPWGETIWEMLQAGRPGVPTPSRRMAADVPPLGPGTGLARGGQTDASGQLVNGLLEELGTGRDHPVELAEDLETHQPEQLRPGTHEPRQDRTAASCLPRKSMFVFAVAKLSPPLSLARPMSQWI